MTANLPDNLKIEIENVIIDEASYQTQMRALTAALLALHSAMKAGLEP